MILTLTNTKKTTWIISDCPQREMLVPEGGFPQRETVRPQLGLQHEVTLTSSSLFVLFGQQTYPLMPINPAFCTHALLKRKLGHGWHRPCSVYTLGCRAGCVSRAHSEKKNIWTTKPLFLIYIQSNWYDTADETNHQIRVLMLWRLLGLYSCNKCPSLQGLYPQVKPECFQSMWTFHSVGNLLLMGYQGIGVKGFLCPHLFSDAPFILKKCDPFACYDPENGSQSAASNTWFLYVEKHSSVPSPL